MSEPKGSINPLWPTPIYQRKIDGEEFDNVQKELYDSIDKLGFEEAAGWGPNAHDLSKDAFHSNFLYEHNCTNTIQFIHDSLIEYLLYVNAQYEVPYIIDAAWITKTKKGKFAYEHSHGFSDVSGVYYINTNGEDGNLQFDNINSGMSGNFIISALKSKEVAPLENGLLLLWPGPLKHGTQANKTDNARLSLSFNILVARPGFPYKEGVFEK